MCGKLSNACEGESNAKMPHNICLVSILLLLGKVYGGGGGGRGGGGGGGGGGAEREEVGTTRQTHYKGIYSSLFGVLKIHRLGSFMDAM